MAKTTPAPQAVHPLNEVAILINLAEAYSKAFGVPSTDIKFVVDKALGAMSFTQHVNQAAPVPTEVTAEVVS